MAVLPPTRFVHTVVKADKTANTCFHSSTLSLQLRTALVDENVLREKFSELCLLELNKIRQDCAVATFR